MIGFAGREVRAFRTGTVGEVRQTTIPATDLAALAGIVPGVRPLPWPGGDRATLVAVGEGRELLSLQPEDGDLAGCRCVLARTATGGLLTAACPASLGLDPAEAFGPALAALVPAG